MGYNFKKVENRKIIIESPRLQGLKITFLRRYIQLMEEDVTFVYLDETWVYQHGVPVRRWVHESDRRGMPAKIVMNEGRRFTILHAGGKFGFLENCLLFLDSNNDSRDYHKTTMNGQLFRQWVETQLIPSVNFINGKVVIIMDNAPYHSVLAEQLPRLSWIKSKLKFWLAQKKIPFGDNLTKKQLWDIIKPLLPSTRKYEIDELLSKSNIEVLRLPPYHCHYNAIEMVWGFCKPYYNKHILKQSSKKSEIKHLWIEAMSKYTPEMWTSSVIHCENIIKDDWQRMMGNTSVKDIPPVIISLGESDSESDLSSDEDDSISDIMQDDVLANRTLNVSMDPETSMNETQGNIGEGQQLCVDDVEMCEWMNAENDIETIIVEVIDD
ncbi:hypothetical protein Zmor_005156 [Zophobas morio]|uniref:Tc1-like transposase DDE domain-containing protein n=1 Tax=Zophobas morio TaxID=2755281 RepID=A0AA38IPE4_9CUCU|nr:hypothetical protein Zmor_005156 [Zophobas morio]